MAVRRGGIATIAAQLFAVGAVLQRSNFQLGSADGSEAAAAALGDPIAARVLELEASLASLRARTEAKVQDDKAVYEANLTAQEKENRALERRNVLFAAQIRDVEQHIGNLRASAARLDMQNVELRREIDNARVNVSTARDFVDELLNTSAEADRAPELVILTELAAEEARAFRLNEVKSSFAVVQEAPSLLQVPSEVQHPEHGMKKKAGKSRTEQAPKDILQILASSLDGLSLQQNETMATFKAMFDMEYQAGVHRRLDLQKEYVSLNVTWHADVGVQSQLDLAVRSLTETNKAMELTRLALLGFLGRVAARPSAAEPYANKVAALLQADENAFGKLEKPRPQSKAKAQKRSTAASGGRGAKASKAKKGSSSTETWLRKLSNLAR